MNEELNQDKSEKFGLYYILVALLLCLIGSILYSNDAFSTIAIDPELSTKGTDVFLTYIFVVVALERATAVYLRIYRNKGKKNFEKRIARISATIGYDAKKPEYNEKLRSSYLKEAPLFLTFKSKDPTVHQPTLPVNPPEEGDALDKVKNEKLLSYFQMILEGYEYKLEDYENGTQRRAARFVFLGGVLMAIMGLSIFDDLLIISQNMQYGQSLLYKLLDILVTGGLIGGGSQSFAMLISTTNSLLENVKAAPKS